MESQQKLGHASNLVKHDHTHLFSLMQVGTELQYNPAYRVQPLLERRAAYHVERESQKNLLWVVEACMP